MRLLFFFASCAVFPLFADISGSELNKGLDFFNQSDFEACLKHLQTAKNENLDINQKAVAELYKAKCLIALKREREAEEALHSLKGDDLKFSPPLFHEWLYTQGLIAFRKQNWEEAILFLEKALPQKNGELADWTNKTALLLSLSYLKLAEDPRLLVEKRQEWRQKETHLQKQFPLFPSSDPAEQNQLDQALKSYQENDFSKASSLFAKYLKENPQSYLADQALYWQARCAEELGNEEQKQNLYRTLYTDFPSSSYALESYFFSYSLQDYLQGNRAALKHLQKLPALYPDSLVTLKALYLLGLDATRDRKTPEGKSLSRKNLTEAIDRFQELETKYQKLLAHEAIPPSEKEEWASLNNRAMLQRARLNFEIAEAAQGAKRSIYMEYAEGIYKELLKELPTSSPIQDETRFGLAMTEIQLGKNQKAEATLHSLSNDANSPYFAAKSEQHLGLLNRNADHFTEALKKGGDLLSIEEKLEIMIEKSLALKAVGQDDLALQQLSEVINYHAVSQLRLKAMYLRAQFYAEQDKPALAKRQLESLALKEGPWGLKAKEQLEIHYGYH